LLLHGGLLCSCLHHELLDLVLNVILRLLHHCLKLSRLCELILQECLGNILLFDASFGEKLIERYQFVHLHEHRGMLWGDLLSGDCNLDLSHGLNLGLLDLLHVLESLISRKVLIILVGGLALSDDLLLALVHLLSELRVGHNVLS